MTYIPGDVNGDGYIDSLDVSLLRRYISDGCQTVPDGYNVIINDLAGDVDANGMIDSWDVICIRRYISDGCQTIPEGYNQVLKPGLPKCEHALEAILEKEATCTEDGNIAYWHCTKCDKYYDSKDATHEIQLLDTVIKHKGHVVVVDPYLAPTEHSVGYTEGSHCSVCGKTIKPQEEIPMLAKEEYSIVYHISNNDPYLAGLTIKNNNPDKYTPKDEIILQDLLVDGYNFKGWYTSQIGGKRVTEIPLGSKGNKVLYAQWEKVPYTIEFDSPDMKVSPVVYTVDKGYILEDLSWFGYTFVGWSNDDGFIVDSIKPGQIPKKGSNKIVLHANWTSNRNKATSYQKFEDPLIVEDSDNAQFLFVYDIGKIENVPLNVIKNIGYTERLDIEDTLEITDTVTQDTAKTIANVVSNATTRSSSMTLSKEWNNTYSSGAESESSQIQSTERTNSLGETVGGKFFVSNSCGGSSYLNTDSGISKNVSSKVALDGSAGIGGSYTRTNEKYHDGKLGLGRQTGQSLGVSFPYKILDVEAGLQASNTFSGEFGWGKKRSSAGTVSGNGSLHIGAELNQGKEIHHNVSYGKSNTWNSESGYEKSFEMSRNQAVTNAISKQISNRTNYNISQSVSGQNSKTESVAGTNTRTDEYSSTVKYSSGNSKTTSKKISLHSDNLGYYRLVNAGTVHVFGVVGYDVATSSYYTYTLNIMADDTHEYLDYSKESSTFDDCENGLVVFDIPYDVEKYLIGILGQTPGLEFDLEGNVTGFTEKEDFNGTVTIPQYYAVDNHDKTFSAHKVKGISSNAFRGNKNIKNIVLPKYVTNITPHAFEDCTNLENVFSFGAEKIGDYAFKNCKKLSPFSIDTFVTELGNSSFEGVPKVEIMASNMTVSDKALGCGANDLTLCISNFKETYDNRNIKIPKSKKFKFIDNGKKHNNLTIESDADETYLSNIKFTNNNNNVLKFSSPKVILNRVSIENCKDFGLVLTSPNTELNLFGNINISSIAKNRNVVLSKNVVLGKDNEQVSSKLLVSGNYITCGNITNDKYLDISKGQLIKINESDFDNYLNKKEVILNPTGGSLENSKLNVTLGNTFGQLPVPKRDGYTFNGWYTSEAGGVKVTENTIVTNENNKTLYAHWTLNALSDWTLKSNMPSGAQVVETKWTYTERSYTTSGSSSLNGWVKYDTKRTGWGGTQGPVNYDPSNGVRNVWSEQYETGRTHHWVYYRYRNPSNNYGSDVQSGSYSQYQEIDLTYALTEPGSNGNHSRGYKYWESGKYTTYWPKREYDDIHYGTRWYFQDPVYTYYYYKDVNKESSSKPSGSNISNVKEWVRYRSK